MINKLRKKIFWIIQISLTIIILGIAIVFTSFSYKNTITSSTMFMDRIFRREDIKNERPMEPVEPRPDEEPFSINIEGIYKIEIVDNEITNESDDVTDEVEKYAIKISKKNQEEGYVDNYIYKVRKLKNDGKEITLIENEDAIKRFKITLIATFASSFIGIVVVYIFAKKLSRMIVKPVEESFENQKRFVSDASHELKTPLAVIEANTDVLQGQIGENKWLTYIQNEIKSMDKLVNDLLTLSKMENIDNVNVQRFDLSKEIKISVSVFESMIYEKELVLETNIEDNIYFNGDKEDIKHIVSIILDNAIKHTDKNGKIIVNAKKEKNDIRIEIKNQGLPIAEADQEKIFERFYRVDKSRNRNEKRYGLGLSIAKGIVDKYGGEIKARSKDGFTTFSVKFNCK